MLAYRWVYVWKGHWPPWIELVRYVLATVRYTSTFSSKLVRMMETKRRATIVVNKTERNSLDRLIPNLRQNNHRDEITSVLHPLCANLKMRETTQTLFTKDPPTTDRLVMQIK